MLRSYSVIPLCTTTLRCMDKCDTICKIIRVCYLFLAQFTHCKSRRIRTLFVIELLVLQNVKYAIQTYKTP